MADSEAVIADGMGFSHRTSLAGATPKVWEELGEAVSVSPPNPSRGTIDVTHLKSPGNTREFRSGKIDPGETTVTFNYTKALRPKVDTIFASTALHEFMIDYPDGATEVFSGVATGKPVEGGEVEGKLTMQLAIKLSGVSVYTAAPVV